MNKLITRPVTIRIGADKVRLLDDLAEVTDRTRAWHVEQALDAYLELQAWQLRHIKKGLQQLEAGQGIPQADIEADLDAWSEDDETASRS